MYLSTLFSFLCCDLKVKTTYPLQVKFEKETQYMSEVVLLTSDSAEQHHLAIVTARRTQEAALYNFHICKFPPNIKTKTTL